MEVKSSNFSPLICLNLLLFIASLDLTQTNRMVQLNESINTLWSLVLICQNPSPVANSNSSTAHPSPDIPNSHEPSPFENNVISSPYPSTAPTSHAPSSSHSHSNTTTHNIAFSSPPNMQSTTQTTSPTDILLFLSYVGCMYVPIDTFSFLFILIMCSNPPLHVPNLPQFLLNLY